MRGPDEVRHVRPASELVTGLRTDEVPVRIASMPRVSVVIPCYNQARFLPDAVASVVAQTFSAWELIVVNDGSPDNTSEVATALITRYPDRRIQLIEKQNGGLGDARNDGIGKGVGEYFLPLDADDCIAPSFLAKAVAVMDAAPGVGFVYSHIQHFGERDDFYYLPEFDAETIVHTDNVACVCSLVRRTAWKQVGGYRVLRDDGYEDWDFWVGCIEQGWRGHRIPEPLFRYRKHGSSMVSRANTRRDELIAHIVTRHPGLYSPERVHRAELLLQGDIARARAPRVLLACTHFWPSVGGLETIVENLGAGLVRRGYDVDIATQPHADRRAQTHRGMRIAVVDPAPAMGQSTPRAQHQLRALISSGQYAACVLFADPLNWVLWSVEDLKRPASTRVIGQPLINADGYAVWRDNTEFRSRLVRLLKGLEAVVALSADGEDARFLRGEGIPFVQVPNAATPPHTETTFRARYRIAVHIPLVLHVANLWKVKNQVGLVEALAPLPGDWRLIMIGHPSWDEDYVRAVEDAAAQDPRCLLIPGLTRADTDQAFEAADVVCLASLGEVSPVAILEAMSHGKPWVATPACGAVNTAAGGIVVPLERFAETVRTLIARPDLANRLGRLGQEHWHACFCWERVLPAWEDLVLTGRTSSTFEMPARLRDEMAVVLREFEHAAAALPDLAPWPTLRIARALRRARFRSTRQARLLATRVGRALASRAVRLSVRRRLASARTWFARWLLPAPVVRK
jgi:glycosyltransferase involved in cell wall biosynthesis